MLLHGAAAGRGLVLRRALLQGGKPKPRAFYQKVGVVQDPNGQLGNLKAIGHRFGHRLGIVLIFLYMLCWWSSFKHRYVPPGTSSNQQRSSVDMGLSFCEGPAKWMGVCLVFR